MDVPVAVLIHEIYSKNTLNCLFLCAIMAVVVIMQDKKAALLSPP